MKKIVCLLLGLILCMGLFSACAEEKAQPEVVTEEEQKTTEKVAAEAEKAEEEIKENELPFDGTRQFWFSSGAGGWYTELNLKKDGTFTGHYQDSEMGIGGEGYQGTLYLCDFKGSFSKIEKVDDYSYRLYLGELTIKDADKDFQFFFLDYLFYHRCLLYFQLFLHFYELMHQLHFQ